MNIDIDRLEKIRQQGNITPFRGHGAGEIELKHAKRLEDVRWDAPLRSVCPLWCCVKVGSGNGAMITKVL